MNERNLPKDIGGYQHVEHGPVLQADIWVLGGKPICFVSAESFATAEDANAYGSQFGFHLYRKMGTPKNHCADDHLWQGGKFPDRKALDKAVETLVEVEPKQTFIPQDDKTRKEAPLYRGLLGYFPAALFAVARHSYLSDQKHNPGSTDGPTWARSKSSDHPDCIIRHLIDSGIMLGGPVPSDDQIYHLTAATWRNLALLQEALESRGAKPGVSSR